MISSNAHRTSESGIAQPGLSEGNHELMPKAAYDAATGSGTNWNTFVRSKAHPDFSQTREESNRVSKAMPQSIFR